MLEAMQDTGYVRSSVLLKLTLKDGVGWCLEILTNLEKLYLNL